MTTKHSHLRQSEVLYKLRVMRDESPDRSVSSMLEELRLTAVGGRKNIQSKWGFIDGLSGKWYDGAE